MAIVETRISVWEALAGRAPGQPVGPADPGLWTAVAERINPAKARPVLRPGIETVELVSARGVPYRMLRSPDRKQTCYLRLTSDEFALAQLMDGSKTLARLVAEFARISGRLAPDQVRRVVADLAGNRMLEELPVDAFAPLQRVRRKRPWPLRLGAGLLAFAQGRRMVLANVDWVFALVYKAGGRLLFTRFAATLMGTVALLGLVAFGYQWWTGEQSVFLSSDSYATGALVLLGLNVVALACHEFGHGLAVKHAGRRVPAAGFLVYFGIPSVFVDTTDVWMAGRRARLLTTAAGPTAGLVLAGASALVGFAVPEAAPWCFKLSFAWYINAMFNLNPFLALDGYYLLMDWLEVPNLRARGLAWVATRVRRRPPVWSGLDREGRLVALYGLLAVAWLVIALNIAYRIYVDRVGGLVTGLWRSGWGARVLLVTVILALFSPVVYVLASWLGRRARRLRQRERERWVKRDEPRRLAALRASTLRDLPEPSLRSLAAGSRWVHPRTGEQIVLAGAAQPRVFAVVDGALEGRAPGDPAGTVRERVGAGGVVGIGPAVTGAPSPLAWYTAGTTLLAMPSSTVASAVGPLAASAGIGFGTASEAEQLLTEAPALAGLSYEDRLGLAAVAVPISLAPGAPVTLTGADTALVLASGLIVTPDGQELARGTMIGPIGEEFDGTVATARTPVRLFSLPAVAGLPLLLGTPPGRLLAEQHGRAPGRPPITGVHPIQAYAPLALPPGPPPPTVDDASDGRFEKKLRWLLILVLLAALLFTGANIVVDTRAWGEMPSDKALMQVEVGIADVVMNGTQYRLEAGEDIFVGWNDTVSVALRSRGRMTYRGGASSLLCAGTRLAVGPLRSASAGRLVAPSAAFELLGGRTINQTATASPAFTDLTLAVELSGGTVKNKGAALFAVAGWGTQVSTGDVFFNGVKQSPVGGPLGCGDGSLLTPPIATGTPSTGATPSETPSQSASPSTSPSSSPTPTTTSKPPTTTSAPPLNNPPSISWVRGPTPKLISLARKEPTGAPKPCNTGGDMDAQVVVAGSDDHGLDQLTVKLFWSSPYGSGNKVLGPPSSSGTYQGANDPIPAPASSTPQSSMEMWATVTDSGGKTAATSHEIVIIQACPLFTPI